MRHLLGRGSKKIRLILKKSKGTISHFDTSPHLLYLPLAAFQNSQTLRNRLTHITGGIPHFLLAECVVLSGLLSGGFSSRCKRKMFSVTLFAFKL